MGLRPTDGDEKMPDIQPCSQRFVTTPLRSRLGKTFRTRRVFQRSPDGNACEEFPQGFSTVYFRFFAGCLADRLALVIAYAKNS
jgi:hypothetical protein